jgi:hypothetical protein
MYLIWQADIASTDTYFYANKVPRGLDTDALETGEEMLTPPPTCTLAWDGKSPNKLSDVVLTQSQFPVWSPKVISVLEAMGVDNIQYFPIDIDTGKGGKVEKSYRLPNILGLINCLDRKHAKFETFPGDPQISWLERYRILEDKIKPLGKGRKPPLVFRLGEFPAHVLAHDSIEKAFQKNGITGAEFIPTEKFE